MSGDVSSNDGKTSWFYSDIVKDHFFNPRNFLEGDPMPGEFNGMGKVGSPACGDDMKVWLFVDPETEKIQRFAWRTFGCGSAIAATSMISVMALENGGMTLDEARAIKPQEVMERLGGLPARKFHCSVLCDKAMRDAINDYYRRSAQFDKIVLEATRLIDPAARVTDSDIEKAVIEGAKTLAEVQQKTKVGVDDPSIIPAVEQLIRFYCEKYFTESQSPDNTQSLPDNKLRRPRNKPILMKIKVKVDPDLCIAAASCITVAPDTFQLNSDNKADVLDHGQAPGGQSYEREIEVTEEEKEKIILAAQSCPTAAVIITDESGKQLYP
ncbi:MAG: iron-sulfur cluster assembly scaffold protein [bacterium]